MFYAGITLYMRNPRSELSLRKPNNHIVLLLVVSFVTICITAYLPVHYFHQQEKLASSLYARAERLYRQRNYAAALACYRKLVENFPEHPLRVFSEMRIVDIHNYLQWLEEFQKEKSHRVYRLMEKTKQAFLNGNFLTPEHDNAIIYIKEILELDPRHQEAQKFKKIIVNYYMDEARTAKLSKNYREAKELYQTVLDITPDDTTAQAELAKLDSFQ